MDGQTHDVCTGMFTHVKTFAGEVVTITSILKDYSSHPSGHGGAIKVSQFLKRVGGSGSKPQVRNIPISIGAEHNKGTDVEHSCVIVSN
jgi:hypothetical protein